MTSASSVNHCTAQTEEGGMGSVGRHHSSADLLCECQEMTVTVALLSDLVLGSQPVSLFKTLNKMFVQHLSSCKCERVLKVGFLLPNVHCLPCYMPPSFSYPCDSVSVPCTKAALTEVPSEKIHRHQEKQAFLSSSQVIRTVSRMVSVPTAEEN